MCRHQFEKKDTVILAVDLGTVKLIGSYAGIPFRSDPRDRGSQAAGESGIHSLLTLQLAWRAKSLSRSLSQPFREPGPRPLFVRREPAAVLSCS